MALSVMGKVISTDFSVRDLNRQPAKVLEACDRLGVIRIRSRKGQIYELRQQTPVADDKKKPAFPDFAARRKAMGMIEMTAEQRKRLDQLIAGE